MVPPCKMADDNATGVFVYTGVGEGAVVPQDVVRVRIDQTVLAIPIEAFMSKYKLQEVQLHDGLYGIGKQAFFACKALRKVQLSDGVERIGGFAFFGCNFTKFRCPPLVTTIPWGLLADCKGMFSLEMPENTIRLEHAACCHCNSLRNVAIAMNTVVGENSFNNCTDLLHILGTEEAIVNASRHRFNELPFHRKMYYISYFDQTTAEEIRNVITIGENDEIDLTGFEQDCVGMTPLHILACSTVQRLELYQLMIANYPDNLIVKDMWGAVPLLYALWGDAPSEILQYLVNSYQSIYPDHEFEWNSMVITLGRANASLAVIQNLLNVRQMFLPGYIIDWDYVLHVLARATSSTEPHACSAMFCFLTRCSIATRVNAIGVKHFRDAMADDWMGDDEDDFDREEWHNETLTKLEYYESEYLRLKESTSLLELGLWKMKLDYSKGGIKMGGGNKKIKMDQSEFRLQCRISCGADHVIENVLPYLLPPDFVRSYVDVSDDDNDDDDNDDDYVDDDNDYDVDNDVDDDDIEDSDGEVEDGSVDDNNEEEELRLR